MHKFVLKSFPSSGGLFALLLAFLLVSFPLSVTAKDTFPAPVGAINDFAGVIKPEYAEKMEILAREVLDAALPPHATAVTIEFTIERSNRVNP